MRDSGDLGPERLFASQGDGTATHGFAEAVAAGLSTDTLSTQVTTRDSGVPASPAGAPGVGAGLSPLSLSLDQQRATVTFATALSPKNHPPCTGRLGWCIPAAGDTGAPGCAKVLSWEHGPFSASAGQSGDTWSGDPMDGETVPTLEPILGKE